MKHERRTTLPGALALVGCALLLVSACKGKGAEGACAEVAACGGDPTGTWRVVDNCAYVAQHPYQPISPEDQVQNPLGPSIAPPQAPQTTTGDWCSQLIYLPADATNPNGHVQGVNLWHDAPSLDNDGTLVFDGTNNYTITLNFSTQSTTHFAPSCLQFAGASPTCDQLGPSLTAFYTANLSSKQVAGAAPPTPGFENIQCVTASDSGCDCFYDYKVQLTDKGTWSAGGNVLTEASYQYLYNGQRVVALAPTHFMVTSFCQSGTQMTLSGYNGSSLSEAVGLRTLTLQRM